MDQSIQRALKKAKIKQWLKIIIISFFVSIVLLIGMNRLGNYLSSIHHKNLHESLFLEHSITQPNINIDSQVTANSSMFGGNIVTNRSKNINGYLVPWSTLTSSYSWFGASIDYNELLPGYFSRGTTEYEYDKQTKQKVPTFYHPKIISYYDGVQNQLPELIKMDNHVAEVAISFKKPMTMEEVKKSIPDALNIVWLYMVSNIGDESKGPLGQPVYGYADNELSVEGFHTFIENLKLYDESQTNEMIQAYIKKNEQKPFSEVTVLGVMLTGRTESFKALLESEYIRGASIGVTVPIVPYIKPTK
ncbi:MAG: sigma factor regulator N-terminal domain-containing protein [Solibacillus sp.]|uniref:sigma factor regulator N-terminal domain-containing protein n=1 Tax=unclassified Solibacillus TaxID=2637870 RepID=UPI0030FA572E